MRALVGFMLLALVLRIPALDQGLWYDEIWTLVDFGRLSFTEVLTTYKSDNNHPLFTLSAWTSMHLLGEQAWTLRLPAMLFGVMSVGAMSWFARLVAPPKEALAATFLLAISYHHVWFSQNARGYTALLFFTITSTGILVKMLEKPNLRLALPYGLLLALGTYTHMTAVFVAMAHAVIALTVIKKNRAPVLGLVIAVVISLLLHATILLEMLQFLFVKKQAAGAKVSSEWQSPWWAIKAVAISLGAGLVPGLIALVGALAVLTSGLISYAKRDWKLVVLFVLPGLLGAVVMLGMGRNLWPRFFFFLAGFLLLILVRGVFALAQFLATLAPFDLRPRLELLFLGIGFVGLFGAFLLMLPRAWGPKQDFIGAMKYVDQVAGPEHVVMTAGLTDLPYERWLHAGFISIADVDELDRQLSTHAGGYLLHTLPTYLESRKPELAREIKLRGQEIKRFRGSVGGGDVVIIQFK